MTQRDDVHKFEQGRIRALQEERLHIQKKTFTKWMNSFLQKARMEVDDLFVDLADGKKLLKLLEIISGEKLAKPNNGKMRVHKIENVNKSLAFLHTKVRLESIGAEDIVDGNPRLILGLIWTIILRFQIQEIEIDVDEENESSEKKSAKDALLLWCQRKTNGYPGVVIGDFTGSWRNGLGFNALIHSHRPDLFPWERLQIGRNIDNLNHAFDVAYSELGIPRLLDAEDVDISRPDEKSILTYVASYYHTFARMKTEMKSGRRIANIVGQMMDADNMKSTYENLTTGLLEWIRVKVLQLEDRTFPNSMEGIQNLLFAFGQYRTVEKPPKYKERSEIEALYFNINTQLKWLQQGPYVPPEGKLLHDLERAWESLERAEHSREVALRSELLRQERLDQLNYKFERKSVLREGYLKEMIQVLSDPRYGSNISQVDATVKKHEAISADILAREERFHDLTNMSEELVRENYHGTEQVKQREAQVLERWHELLDLLDKHKTNLSLLCTLMSMLREVETTMGTIKELQMQFQSGDVGSHLLAVEDLRQGHSLQELQVAAIGETVRRLHRQGQQHATTATTLAQQYNNKEVPALQSSIANLQKAYEDLIESSKIRRDLLEDARNFYQFIQDQEDEEAWLVEKQRICKAGITAKDLRAVLSLQQKHKALQDEMNARHPKSQQLCEIGEKLIQDKHPKAAEIQPKINSIQENWTLLQDLSALRKKQLDEAAVAYQFYTDANEADSWLNEKMALVASNDYGLDEPSAQALLQRHRDLQSELNAYSGDIQSLNSQADKLIKAGVSTLSLGKNMQSEPDTIQPETVAPREEWVNETRLVPTEVWEDEPIERVEYRTEMEERTVRQVKALYPFSGQGMNMAKGEIMFLLSETNPDWWSVRKADGTDGFVPANYVKQIEPRIIQIPVRVPEKIKTIQRVKKTKMVKQVVPVKRIIPVAKVSPAKRKISTKTESDNDNVEKRLTKINDTYKQLKDLAHKRHALLEDSIHLFGFYRECDDFEKWIKDKEKLLRADEGADSTNVEAAKRKYEKFLTDLSASGKRIEAIDTAVEEFVKQGHSQLDKVKARQRQIHQQWDNLNRLKAQKERNLEGASSVELFNRTCDEARDWMNEKMTQLDTAELGPDLRTVQALQRRHQHLERELAPVEEKVNRVNLLANTVKSSYPNEQANVNTRQKEVLSLWDQVKTKALERRSRLENAVGQQIFMNSSKSLINWVATVKEQLNAETSARDVATAQNLIKNHNELGDDIRAHDDEFREVATLGTQLLQRNPHLTEIPERLERLQAEHQAIERGWDQKNDWLQQCLQLQLFNREADQIDASSSGHEAFLEFNDLGASLDDVEALLKRHDDFESMLSVQDERIKLFTDMADKLIAENHYDSANINDRKNQVLNRRQAIKDLALARRKALLASRNYQKFSAEVDDLKDWLADKSKTAADESYRDLNNLERKLQKHEAFERELRANEGQLRNVNKTGQSLISQNNYRKSDVAQMLHDLNKEWEQLVALSLDKGRRLRQAAAQHGYNRTIEDARMKLEEIKKSLQSKQVGHDLRSCKELLKKHQVLENDIAQWKQRVNDLVEAGNEMAYEDHFDADNILKATKVCQAQFMSLEEPCRRRREALDESLRFHKFGFELDAELQWIGDHLPLASSDLLGQNLYQAQSLHKKHKKLQEEIRGHRPMIDKTLSSGQALIDQKHPEDEKIEALCQSLQDSWDDLESKAEDRARKLNLSLKAQEFFFEASEVESWLNERSDVLSSTDYGRDRDAATKLLTRHKALELELDTYNAIVTEMGHNASAMVTAKHPDAKAIQAKHQLLAQQLRSLQRLAVVRQQRLMESMYRHEYFMESADLEQWIKEQEMAASSEDYGQDYEHLLILQVKFDDFKHRIESGLERFNQCEELAKKLIANESPYAQDIECRQGQLGESWERLLGLIKHRGERLEAAAQIHRYNRDTAELLARIQQKFAELGTDPGRDLRAVLALLRKHEVFENDLVALDAQLQVLIEDAEKLQKIYPVNADTVVQQRDSVLLAWDELQQKKMQRKEKLEASCDLQKFLAQVRDLMNWSSNLRTAMSTEVKVRDAAGAQTLKVEHEAIKNEIEARDFQSVVDLSEAMIQTGHYAAVDVEDKRNQLLDERDKLYAAWQHKQIYLDQLIDLHLFLREAKQIDALSSTQEAALSSTSFATTVDEVDAQAKKHDAFEKLIQAQDEKVSSLKQRANNLVSQDHFESPLILRRLDEVIAKRHHVKRLTTNKRQQLDDALLYAQFVRDVTETNLWIAEKQKRLEAAASSWGEVHNLEDKIKKLQKHQAFQAEIAANEGRVYEIKEKGNTLLAKKHHASQEIQEQMNDLLFRWRELLNETDSRGRGLEEAQDILEFNNQLDKIEAWIRDKEMMVQANDTGRDYEHCMALQRKLDDVDSDMRVDDQRVKTINGLADKLINKEGPIETKSVQQRRDVFLRKWRALQGALSAYRDTLSGALEVHLFNRDVDDTGARINEKALALSTDDTGRDLADVQVLQRKQETLERDLTAIEGKIFDHEKDAKKLINKYPAHSENINSKLQSVKDSWNNLQENSKKRRETLANAYTLEKFKTELRELEAWVADTIKRMDVAGAPNTIEEAQAAIELHLERKAEIDGRQDIFRGLYDHGKQITETNPECSVSLEKLDDLRNMLNNAWEQRKIMLTQAHQLQLFKEQADQIDSWLATKEAFLNNDDLGESIASVEALLRKHDAFEKMLTSQMVRVDELERFANDILQDNHYDSDAILRRLRLVMERKDRLLDSANGRRKKLIESQQLQQFLRNIYEVESWLAEKIQIATDENYRDPSNLQTKIQKHTAFDAEIVANNGRIAALVTEGEDLIADNHFASQEIQGQLEDLENEWQHLQEQSQLKRDRLHDAYQAAVFNRSLEEFEIWMDDVEAQLHSDDLGKDLSSVNNLLKKHTNVENDILQHAEVDENIKETISQFEKTKHFMFEEINERAQNAIRRYSALQSPMQLRRDNLEDAAMLQQLICDVDEEMQWLEDKEPLARSNDLGTSLNAVQSLQKKHQTLEAELAVRDPVVNAIVARGQQMIRAGHFAAQRIEKMTFLLSNKLAQLRDVASVRRLRLLDAVESQMFYTEANEAETWIGEKRPVASSTDYGKDENSVQILIKKLESFDREQTTFQSVINKLSTLSRGLIERRHFDSENIAAKQAHIEMKYDELKIASIRRRKRLNEALEYFKFVRESEEVQEWIVEQTKVADSEDYGTDVEHVELLIQTFETFHARLIASEGRVIVIQEAGKKLIENKHPDTEKIQSKLDETQQLWEGLKDLAQARQDALAGAKQVHVFDRTADETIAWIAEKESSLVVAEGYGQDLETIQALVRRHQGFETDLAAVQKQVDAVVDEAVRLANLYPDAREHVEVKNEETMEAWNDLLEKAAQHKDKLKQAEQLQSYFDEYRDLMAWINEMVAKITAPELAQDVSGAEALIARHNEHKTEINTRKDVFNKFYQIGQELIKDGHFLGNEINDKISVLKQRKQLLDDTWEKRKNIYEQNLDTQLFKREAEALEKWIQSREPLLNEGKLGETISQVEDLIRKHEDFEKTIEAQEEKFNALRRTTLLEQAFQQQRQAELAARQAEKERLEKERLEARKRKEMERITEERRREDGHITNHTNMNGNSTNNGTSSPSSTNYSIPETEEPSPLTKSNSFAHIFGDRLRRGGGDNSVKRAESMKVTAKVPKRTPSFTTRRRTQSFRKNDGGFDDPSLLPPVDMEGFLERKHELTSGGRKANVRSWKTMYTVLCGQLLCFFKNKDDFAASKAAASPVVIMNAKCEVANDYTKKKYAFRLTCTDASEFLFLANNDSEMKEWINKITFHAKLPPSQQLLSYDEGIKTPDSVRCRSRASTENASTTSSQGSSPDSQRRSSVGSNTNTSTVTSAPSSPPPPSVTSLGPQTQFLQQHMSQVRQKSVSSMSDKPPIPPRGAPPPIPVRSETLPANMRRNTTDMTDSVQRPPSYSLMRNNQQNGSSGQGLENWAKVGPDGAYPHYLGELPPPLPITEPPLKMGPLPPPRLDGNANSAMIHPHLHHHHHPHHPPPPAPVVMADPHIRTEYYNSHKVIVFQPHLPPAGRSSVPAPNTYNRPMSMPPSYMPPPAVAPGSSTSLSSADQSTGVDVAPRRDKRIFGLFNIRRKESSQN